MERIKKKGFIGIVNQSMQNQVVLTELFIINDSGGHTDEMLATTLNLANSQISSAPTQGSGESYSKSSLKP